jgi:hypothetical protein
LRHQDNNNNPEGSTTAHKPPSKLKGSIPMKGFIQVTHVGSNDQLFFRVEQQQSIITLQGTTKEYPVVESDLEILQKMEECK